MWIKERERQRERERERERERFQINQNFFVEFLDFIHKYVLMC
jgi:hypothetical protein